LTRGRKATGSGAASRTATSPKGPSDWGGNPKNAFWGNYRSVHGREKTNA